MGHQAPPLEDQHDPLSEEGHQALARMVIRLFDHWDLPLETHADLLGLSAAAYATLNRYREGHPLADDRDLLERVAHLLGIHKNLRSLFPHNRELVYRWPTTCNSDFGNCTPVDVVVERGLEGILRVRRNLDLATCT